MQKLWEPLNSLNRINPYPMYSELRKYDPVHKSQTGEWILTRYVDVKNVLTSKSFGCGNRKIWLERSVEYLSTKDIDIHDIIIAINSFVLQLNPPSHTKIRRFITDNWSKTGVEKIIKENVTQTLKEIKTTSFDVVEDFTSKIPPKNITKIMGLPLEDYQYLHSLSSEMIKALDLYVSLKELVILNNASRKFISYFRSKLESGDFEDGLVSELLAANNASEEPLTNNEFISVLIFLFVASEETSVSLLSLLIYHISKNKLGSQFQNEETIGLHLEELIRYDSPVQLLGRIALENLSIEDKVIKKGDTITLAIGAANRDPDFFDAPDEILLTRNPKHLSFGKGIHFCLGDWLARQTATLAIHSFYEKFSQIELLSEPDIWYDNIAIRGFKSLKVRVKS